MLVWFSNFRRLLSIMYIRSLVTYLSEGLAEGVEEGLSLGEALGTSLG